MNQQAQSPEPPSGLPGGTGLWAGFLDRLPAARAVQTVQQLEAAGVTTVWLPEYSGVDPFVRAALYLSATERLVVATGVATIHARDAEAMVAVSSTLAEAFPGRFVLGLGASHRHLVESRGHEFVSPLRTMRDYLAAMDEARGRRVLPPRVLGALGPKMLELGVEVFDGVHTYFMPVVHTATLGERTWSAPTVMVAADREAARDYLGLCLPMPSYRSGLLRHGFTEADLDSASDAVLDALVVPAEPAAVAERVAEQCAAGADHVVLQLVPPTAEVDPLQVAALL